MNLADLGLVDTRTEVIQSPDAMRELAATVASECSAGAFVGMIGGLGAGKTTFMQGFVGQFSPDVDVMSPTYSLLNIYNTTPKIFHFDLYRLESIDDLESVGYWDVVESDGISCVEWIDKIPDAWPSDAPYDMALTFEHAGDARHVTVWERATAR